MIGAVIEIWFLDDEEKGDESFDFLALSSHELLRNERDKLVKMLGHPYVCIP